MGHPIAQAGGNWRPAGWALGLRTAMVAGSAVLAGGLSTAWILAGHDRLGLSPGLYAAYVFDTAWALIAAGLLVWQRRPASRYGAALVAVGFLVFLFSLEGSRNPVANALGVLSETLAIIGITYLVLTFPTGRLGRLERVALVFMASALLVGRVVLIVLAGDVADYSPFGTTTATGAADPFLIDQHLWSGGTTAALGTYVRLGVGLVILGAIPSTLVLAGGWRLRLKAPAVLGLAVAAALFIAFRVAELAGSFPIWLFWMLAGACFVLPWMFAVALLAGRALAIRSLARMVTAPNTGTRLDQIQGLVRRALGDPRLRLALQEADTRVFVDVHGIPIGRSVAGRDQRWTELSDGPGPAVAMIHDGALAEDPEVLQAAARAAGLVVANAQLMAELQRVGDALNRTRQRNVDVSDTARRGLERDLNDRAEQPLLAARAALGRAREQARGRTIKALAEVDDMLGGVQDALTDIGQGLEPGLLRDRGLTVALGQVVAWFPGSVSLGGGAIRRHSHEVESAVYFCCLEAVQNALKHGGPGARVRVRLWEETDRVYFEVRDSGLGFDRGSALGGAGLQGMTDRIRASAGTVIVWSAAGAGTVVSGWVPADPDR